MRRNAFVLFVTVALLVVLGCAMVFNTTSAEVLDRSLDRSLYHVLVRQLLYMVIGVGMAFAVWHVGYEQVLRLSGVCLGFGCILLTLVFVPGIGQHINGAHRWLGVGGASFQPSELVKYLIPLHFIHAVTACQREINFWTLLKILSRFVIPLTLIVLEPDNGTVVIILVALVALLVLTKIRWLYWALPLTAMMVAGGVAAFHMPHVRNRLEIYRHPERDLQGKGHQPYQAKVAAGSGGAWGRGLGESLQKLDYLPEARSDYIAAIFAEELGFVGMCGLITLYAVLAYSGFSIAAHAPTLPAMYTAGILTFLICFQAFLNLGVVSGLLPSKGTNLPLFSHGGSSLVANLIVVGLLLNISRGQRDVATK